MRKNAAGILVLAAFGAVIMFLLVSNTSGGTVEAAGLNGHAVKQEFLVGKVTVRDPSHTTHTISLSLQSGEKEAKAAPDARLRCGWWLKWSGYWFPVNKPAGAGWNTIYFDPQGNLYQYACSWI